jgi:hypothetical protein
VGLGRTFIDMSDTFSPRSVPANDAIMEFASRLARHQGLTAIALQCHIADLEFRADRLASSPTPSAPEFGSQRIHHAERKRRLSRWLCQMLHSQRQFIDANER